MRWDFLTLTSLSLFISVANSYKPADPNTCLRQLDGLYPTGLCEQRLLYCENGRSAILSCPSPFVFNSDSNFCESPQDVLASLKRSPIKEESVGIGEGHDRTPFVGMMEQQRKEASGAGEVHPFVGMMGEGQGDAHIEEDAQEEYYPFVGKTEATEDEGDGESYQQMDPSPVEPPSVLESSMDAEKEYIQPRDDKREDEMEVVHDQFLSGQKLDDEEFTPAPIIDHFWPKSPPLPKKKEQYQAKAKQPDSYKPISKDWLHDQFLGEAIHDILPSKQKPLMDKFMGKPMDEKQVSEFALINSPANAGHDSFHVKPPENAEHSEFVPFNTPVDVGHDIFKHRSRRSAKAITGMGKEIEICQQQHNESSALKQVSNKTECTRKQIPHGCRPYYLSCVNGRPVPRFCPMGLFFDATKETCQRVQHIGQCTQVHAQPKSKPVKVVKQKKTIHRNGPATVLAQNISQEIPSWKGNQKSNKTQSTETKITTIVPSIATISPLPEPTIGMQSTDAKTTAAPSIATTSPLSEPTTQPHFQHIMPTDSIGGSVDHSATAHSAPIRPTYADFYPEQFCSTMADGFYHHPKNCSRIVQCFANVLFEYPPCQHDLAFNERTGICDYKSNVPGCASVGQAVMEMDSSKMNNTESVTTTSNDDNGCLGHNHGDHLEDPADCTRFRRCVFGHLLPMSCPHGTVFNPKLSVCDYPGHVQRCRE